RKGSREPRALQLPFTVFADVAQKQVAESNSLETFRDGAAAGIAHARLIIFVAARPRQRNLPERKANRFRLSFQQLAPHSVHGDTVRLLVDGSENRGHISALLPQH